MTVNNFFLILLAAVLLFAAIAGICNPHVVAGISPGFEETALIHGGLVHDEPILSGDAVKEPVIITAYS